MKFVLAAYGTRGDVEPNVVVGRELLRRGHDVRMAVPPNLVGFAEAAGLAAVASDRIRRRWWKRISARTSLRISRTASGG